MRKLRKILINKVLTTRTADDEIAIGVDNHRRLAKWLNRSWRRRSHEARQKLFDNSFDDLLQEIGPIPEGLPSIQDGWLKFKNPSQHLPKIDQVVEAGGAILDADNDKSDYKSYFKVVRVFNHLDKYPEILEFALSPGMLKVVGDYLGTMPVLKYINAIVSPPVPNNQPEGSQLFHMDVEDSRVARVLLYIDDVDKQTGPFSFLPASISKEVKTKTGYGNRGVPYRLPDEEAYKYTSKDNLVVTSGKKGDVFICDTSNCFHYGSRGQTKPRRLFMFSFTSDVLENYHFDTKTREREAYRAISKRVDHRLQKLVLNDELN